MGQCCSRVCAQRSCRSLVKIQILLQKVQCGAPGFTFPNSAAVQGPYSSIKQNYSISRGLISSTVWKIHRKHKFRKEAGIEKRDLARLIGNTGVCSNELLFFISITHSFLTCLLGCIISLLEVCFWPLMSPGHSWALVLGLLVSFGGAVYSAVETLKWKLRGQKWFLWGCTYMVRAHNGPVNIFSSAPPWVRFCLLTPFWMTLSQVLSFVPFTVKYLPRWSHLLSEISLWRCS